VAEVRSKARERLDPRKEGGARRPVEKIAPPEQGSDEWQLCRDALDSWVQRLLINRIAIHKVRPLPHACPLQFLMKAPASHMTRTGARIVQ
jgi:hypothetical protein